MTGWSQRPQIWTCKKKNIGNLLVWSTSLQWTPFPWLFNCKFHASLPHSWFSWQFSLCKELVTVKPVLKAIIIYLSISSKEFSLGIILFFMSEHFTGIYFSCSNTLELNCTDSLIQMCAKSRMSGIELFYFSDIMAVYQSHSHKSNSESCPS